MDYLWSFFSQGGMHRPDRFPTIEEYRRLERQWVTPEYPSVEDLVRVEGPYA